MRTKDRAAGNLPDEPTACIGHQDRERHDGGLEFSASRARDRRRHADPLDRSNLLRDRRPSFPQGLRRQDAGFRRHGDPGGTATRLLIAVDARRSGLRSSEHNSYYEPPGFPRQMPLRFWKKDKPEKEKPEKETEAPKEKPKAPPAAKPAPTEKAAKAEPAAKKPEEKPAPPAAPPK